MDQQPSLGLKSPATFEEQIKILKKRGLVIEDEDIAFQTLQRISYYRLSAYGLGLKNNDQFHTGVTFTQIHALYEFDHRFHYLIMDLTEQVEIAFRTHISWLFLLNWTRKSRDLKKYSSSTISISMKETYLSG